MFTFKRNKLFFKDKEIIKLDKNIVNIVGTASIAYVMLEREVCLVDRNGKIIWTVLNKYDDDYVNILLKENLGILLVGTWGGYTYKIDIKNGEVLERNFTK